MIVPNVVAIRCNWCSRQLPAHRTHRLESNQVICDDCLEWHFHALDILGGAMPSCCQVCGGYGEFSREKAEGVEIKMYVVPKDGILQVLCRECVKPYTAKRGDLYRGTEYGKELKL